MKKVLSIAIICLLAFSFTSCGDDDAPSTLDKMEKMYDAREGGMSADLQAESEYELLAMADTKHLGTYNMLPDGNYLITMDYNDGKGLQDYIMSKEQIIDIVGEKSFNRWQKRLAGFSIDDVCEPCEEGKCFAWCETDDGLYYRIDCGRLC